MSKRTQLNVIYTNMKARCYNPNDKRYKDYGGRGITICPEWFNTEKFDGRTSKGFIEFKKWALAHGYQYGLSIDRIDNNKGYSPENCRWITNKEQCNNRRSNHLITYKGKTQNLKQWCDELNYKYTTIYMRIYNSGWTVERAFENK